MHKNFENSTYIRPDEHKFRWPNNDSNTWGIIAHDYIHTIKPLIKILQEKSIIKNRGVFQAGGHCGLYPYMLTEYFDMIFTCEPNPVSFYCLVNNCQGNNIIKLNVALGKQPGKMQSVCEYPDNTGMNRVVETKDKYYIPMITIDSLGLDDIDLMQLDLEGFEYDALVGAKETIERNKPVIIVESTSDNVDTFLAEFGYVNWKKINRLDTMYVLAKDLDKLSDVK